MRDRELGHIVPFEFDQIVGVGRILQKKDSAVHFEHFPIDDASILQRHGVDRSRGNRGWLFGRCGRAESSQEREQRQHGPTTHPHEGPSLYEQPLEDQRIGQERAKTA